MDFCEIMLHSEVETDKQNHEVSGRNGFYLLVSGVCRSNCFYEDVELNLW